MSAVDIGRLVRSLGRTYSELTGDGVIEEQALTPFLKNNENEDLVHKPLPGMELWFWAGTMKLERIVITLIPRTADAPAYKGELPMPFVHQMTQLSIRAILGEPHKSKGPAKLPPPIGVTGGWDAYRLDGSIHPNAEVAIQFLADKSACGLAFRLIDKGHD